MRHSTYPTVRRWQRRAALAVAITLFQSLVVIPSAQALISRREALAREKVTRVAGERAEQWRVCSEDEETFDLRKLVLTGTFDDKSQLSIGNDCGGSRAVAVGGSVTGTLDHSLTWEQVKTHYDADGLRFEGADWLAAMDLSIVNVEDGFAPRVADGTEDGNTVRFLLADTYMHWIRDDAIENDALMSGVIRDVLVDGTNRFLSARPSEGASYANGRMVVRIEDVLVHMKAMPNEHADDGVGFGGIFKWSDQAGRVEMSDSVFLLDERPAQDEPFPPGRYSKVTLVLAFEGGYRGDLPNGVRVTHDLSVWTKARRAWLRAHG